MAQIKSGHGVFGAAEVVAEMNAGAEEESIDKNDIFGEYLLSDNDGMTDVAFDPSEDNPFACYLYKLAADLGIPVVIHVDGGKLDIHSDFRFPYYDVYDEELDRIANGSRICRNALEIGQVRLSEIPEELMADATAEARQEWLEDRISEKFGGLKNEDLENLLEKVASLTPHNKKIMKLLEKKEQSQSTSSETEEEGDDQ